MFLSRIQLYLLIGAAFVLGVLGIYANGVQRGVDRTRRKIDERRIEQFQKAKQVREDVEILDDTELANRAREWTRNEHETDVRERR